MGPLQRTRVIDLASIGPGPICAMLLVDAGAGVLQPGPAPRFDRCTAEPPTPSPAIGMHTDAVLSEAGFSADEISALHASGVALRP